MYKIAVHAGRMAWDEWLLVGVIAVPLIIAVSYLVLRVVRSSR